MHYHCEIIIPPTDDVEASIATIMNPFSENDNEEDRHYNTFWDFYVIGGRWAGTKLIQGYDKAKVAKFYEWLKAEGIAVSGVQCGKQELSPSSQIAKVDKKWNEMFPPLSGEIVPCPIFQHSNDQYNNSGSSVIEGDICKLKDAMLVICSRVIFGGPSWVKDKRSGPIEAVFMLTQDIWNGVNYIKTGWDGKMPSAVEQFHDKAKNYSDSYRDAVEPKDDWLCVTIDYHS